MGKIDYRKIYELNKDEWRALTREPQKYEALLAGHYSDSNHFVYELLQNAEDARATRVVIEYHEDKLIFYHNGKPFDEGDVKGVSSMLMGTKDKNDASTIGKFGMGFKSVFKYTYQPEVYSDEEAFRIENYLLPVEMPKAWDYQEEKQKLSYEVSDGGRFTPFTSSEHLTKFIIPFIKKKDDGSIVNVPGNEVLTKLEGLTGEILLFLMHIKVLYWVDKKTGKYAKIMLSEAENDGRLITCRIEGSAYAGKEEISRYLKYKKVFNHPEMSNAEVSVAYKVNNRANNINEMANTDVWVYFPTRDNTDLPFLIHGSFETAVSREKLMAPSAFNDALFDELGNLIVESLEDLKNRKMITQVFIRRVLIAAFKDEENNNTIPGLKEKVSECFRQGEYLPDREGCYRAVDDVVMAVPFGIADFYGNRLFTQSFAKVKGFVAFNNEREVNFTEYFYWLINELDVHTFTLDKWADRLMNIGEQKIGAGSLEDLKAFYAFLSDNRESLYSSNLSYTRSGPYERMIKNSIVRAWEVLKRAPLILNAENMLVPAVKDGTPNIYLGASSKYKSVVTSAIVNTKIASDFERLLEDGFGITEFDNFQYIKEKIIKKYINIGSEIGFEDDDHFEVEYIEDIQQIIRHLEETHNISEMQELLEDAYIIKIKKDSGKATFAIPGEVHTDISEEGIDLDIYYAPIPYDEETVYDEEDEEYTEYEYFDFDYYALDKDFYLEHGISIKQLELFGLITTPIEEGNRRQEGVGDGYWVAMGEYCPQMEINGIDDNLEYIERHPDEELARQKSAEIFKLLLLSTNKLHGKVRYRKNSPYEKEGKAWCLNTLTSYHDWIYCKDGKMANPSQISKYDLDTSVYGELHPSKEKYEVLGFIETSADNKADAFELVDALDKRDKKLLLKQLARELGLQVGESTEEVYEEDEEAVFKPDKWISSEFPIHKVRNKESLIQHVREQFFCADPVKYMPVLRQIRVSKSARMMRSYVIGMYTNESNAHICQICREPVQFIEVVEIANFGLELPQVHLSLCKNCASKYKSIRDNHKDDYKKQIHQAIISMDLENADEEFEIGINSDITIAFTQTHLAELQTLLMLIDEYGLPNIAEEGINNGESRGCGPLGNLQRNSSKKVNDTKHALLNEKRISDIGARVKHQIFGIGTVQECFGDRIKILFDNGKEKTLSLRMCCESGYLSQVENNSSDDTIKQEFFEFLEKRNYTLSYKMPFLLSFIKNLNSVGDANVEDVLDDYIEFYSNRVAQGLPIDRVSCPYSSEKLKDRKLIRASMIANPCEKFEKRGFLHYSKDTGTISMNHTLFNEMQKEDFIRVKRQMLEDIENYYKKI